MDKELEKTNMYASAHVLKDVWSHTVINDHPVVCTVYETGSELIPEVPNETWISQHVRQHRYGLQIVKCLNGDCCAKFETNWMTIFPDRFMPFPSVYKYGPSGVEIVEPSVYFQNKKSFKFATLSERLLAKLVPKEAPESVPVPFDIYCDSMQKKIKDCICEICGQYWPCCAAKKRHLKAHKLDKSNEVVEQNELFNESANETVEPKNDDSIPMPVFYNLRNGLVSPFIQITDKIDLSDLTDSGSSDSEFSAQKPNNFLAIYFFNMYRTEIKWP